MPARTRLRRKRGERKRFEASNGKRRPNNHHPWHYFHIIRNYRRSTVFVRHWSRWNYHMDSHLRGNQLCGVRTSLGYLEDAEPKIKFQIRTLPTRQRGRCNLRQHDQITAPVQACQARRQEEPRMDADGREQAQHRPGLLISVFIRVHPWFCLFRISNKPPGFGGAHAGVSPEWRLDKKSNL